MKTYWPVIFAAMFLLVLEGTTAALTAIAGAYIGCVIALEHRRSRDA
jgi:hypothetical protein